MAFALSAAPMTRLVSCRALEPPDLGTALNTLQKDSSHHHASRGKRRETFELKQSSPAPSPPDPTWIGRAGHASRPHAVPQSERARPIRPRLPRCLGRPHFQTNTALRADPSAL